MSVNRKLLFVVSLSLSLLLALASQAVAYDEDVDNGKALFGEFCAVCHGYDGTGRVGAALSDWFASIDPEAFVRATISDGVAGTMPAFEQSKGGPLTDEEIDEIAAYIFSWQERVEPAPTPTPVPVTPIPPLVGVRGDPTAGAQIFARDCQVCHGDRGKGGLGASLSGPIAAPQPAAYLREVIRNGVEGAPMPAFAGALPDDDIENVVAFILSWERRPAPQTTPEPEASDGFNWLVAVLFLVLALAVAVWLVTRFSRREIPE
jgi:mono/diheme cytochrome c family protein